MGYVVSLTEERDMGLKISKFIKITGVRSIKQAFSLSLVQRHTRLKIYKILARPILAYGSEAWPTRKADERRLTTSEKRFM